MIDIFYFCIVVFIVSMTLACWWSKVTKVYDFLCGTATLFFFLTLASVICSALVDPYRIEDDVVATKVYESNVVRFSRIDETLVTDSNNELKPLYTYHIEIDDIYGKDADIYVKSSEKIDIEDVDNTVISKFNRNFSKEYLNRHYDHWINEKVYYEMRLADKIIVFNTSDNI